MKVAYWIVSALLSLLYLYAGGRKMFQSNARLRPLMPWVGHTPMWLVRAIGVIEVSGVAGLTVAPATGVVPRLAIVAAIGFVVLQMLAAGLHLSRGEGVKGIGLNAVLIGLAGVEIWLATVW
jgi:DoxX-like family